MSTGHTIQLKGFRLKDGRLVRNTRQLSVSERIRQHKSKRVRVVTRSIGETNVDRKTR
jgi:hypothetical protein